MSKDYWQDSEIAVLVEAVNDAPAPRIDEIKIGVSELSRRFFAGAVVLGVDAAVVAAVAGFHLAVAPA